MEYPVFSGLAVKKDPLIAGPPALCGLLSHLLRQFLDSFALCRWSLPLSVP